MDLLRSNINACWRIFLDRLTTDQQPLDNPSNPDAGPGDTYIYANVGDSNNFGIGFDCSGWCGVGCATALFGFPFWVGKGYYRLFATGTFSNWAQSVNTQGGHWKQTTQDDLVNGSYPIKVMIHQGDGEDGHMAMWVDGWNEESNGTYGLCTAADEITGVASNYWDTWWVWDGQITEDTTERQPMGYPQVLDYAGGTIPGAALAAAGITGVCRYINDGGTGLPKKLLTADEFVDLCQNGIQVYFNFETTAEFMLTDNGAADAQQGLGYVQSLLAAAQSAGINTSGYDPVIYFSADFDEPPADDGTIEAFLDSAKSVLGVRKSDGKSCAAMYGAYWILMRANNSGHVDFLWQTEAWSGGNIDSVIALMQRNSLGYMTIAGVQCDINEQHISDAGQFVPNQSQPGGPPVQPTPPADDDFVYPSTDDMIKQIWEQLFGPESQGWPELFGMRADGTRGKYTVEAVADLHAELPTSPSNPSS